jgi:hypothetical protein
MFNSPPDADLELRGRLMKNASVSWPIESA